MASSTRHAWRRMTQRVIPCSRPVTEYGSPVCSVCKLSVIAPIWRMHICPVTRRAYKLTRLPFGYVVRRVSKDLVAQLERAAAS